MDALLISFGVIFLAELPDKSLFASLVLGTRLRPLGVWLGVAVAFGLHVVLAVLAGKALTLLPDAVVATAVAALFLIGGLVLLLRRPEGPTAAAEAAAAAPPAAATTASATAGAVRTTPGLWRAALTSFGVVLLGELGDITQVTTANLAARFDNPWMVGAGALLALWSAAALAITAGRTLLRAVPLRALQRLAGAALLALAILSALDAVRAA